MNRTAPMCRFQRREAEQSMMQAPSPRWCCPAGAGWPVPAYVGHRYEAQRCLQAVRWPCCACRPACPADGPVLAAGVVDDLAGDKAGVGGEEGDQARGVGWFPDPAERERGPRAARWSVCSRAKGSVAGAARGDHVDRDLGAPKGAADSSGGKRPAAADLVAAGPRSWGSPIRETPGKVGAAPASRDLAGPAVPPQQLPDALDGVPTWNSLPISVFIRPSVQRWSPAKPCASGPFLSPCSSRAHCCGLSFWQSRDAGPLDRNAAVPPSRHALRHRRTDPGVTRRSARSR
jgi:hypothetical protein